MSVAVKAHLDDDVVRFILRPSSDRALYPTFLSLCDELVFQLRLPTSAAALADQHRADLLIWTLNRADEFEHLRDDRSLRAALDRNPGKLSLKLLPNTSRAPSSDMPCPNPRPIDTPASQLRLFQHLRNHATELVSAEVEKLVKQISQRGDGARMRKARHELAKLFTPFLKAIADKVEGKMSKAEYTPVQNSLVKLLKRWGISKETVAAAAKTVHHVCSCRFACGLIRDEYAVLACERADDSKGSGRKKHKHSTSGSSKGQSSTRTAHRKLPVKFYTTQFAILLRAGGEDVRDEYYRFHRTLREHPADEKRPFTLSRRLCRAVQREAFHFLRCHVKGKKLHFENNSLRSLVHSIWRKLVRAGFNEKLKQHVSNLVVAMVRDVAIVELAYSWANDLEKYYSVDDDGKVPDVLADTAADFRGDLRQDTRVDFRKDFQEWPTYNRDQRFERDDRHDAWPARQHEPERDDIWRHGQSHRSNSRGSRSDGGSRHHRRKRGQFRQGGSEDSLPSLHSWQGRDRHRRDRKKLDVSMDRPDHYDSFFSPVHSSEELPTLGVHPEDLLTESSSEESDSSDTQRSQWGRVEMEKERELEMERQLAEQERLEMERLMQVERERHLEKQLAREREREGEVERKEASRRSWWSRLRVERSSRKRSHGSPRGDHKRSRSRDTSRSRGSDGRYTRERSRRPSPEQEGRHPLDKFRDGGGSHWSNESLPDSGTRNIYDDDRRPARGDVFRQTWD